MKKLLAAAAVLLLVGQGCSAQTSGNGSGASGGVQVETGGSAGYQY